MAGIPEIVRFIVVTDMSFNVAVYARHSVMAWFMVSDICMGDNKTMKISLRGTREQIIGKSRECPLCHKQYGLISRSLTILFCAFCNRFFAID